MARNNHLIRGGSSSAWRRGLRKDAYAATSAALAGVEWLLRQVLAPVLSLLSRRGTAIFIDVLVASTVAASIMQVPEISNKTNNGNQGLGAAFLLVATNAAYYIFATGLLGWTLGKRIVGLRVISLGDGGPPGVRSSFLRLLSIVTPVLANQIPFAPSRLTRSASRSRDRLSGSVVVPVALAHAVDRLDPERRTQILAEISRGTR
jgi:uncharacterized RDD family membrane protein YckC